MIRIVWLEGDPGVDGSPDEVDWYGLPVADRVVVPTGRAVELGLDGVECIPDPAGSGRYVAIFDGSVRLGDAWFWVPAGALLRARGPAEPGEIVASWWPFRTRVIAAVPGHLTWEMATERTEDVTGLQGTVTREAGDVSVVRDGRTLQRRRVPAGTLLFLEQGAACMPGALLATWFLDGVSGHFEPGAPLPSATEAVTKWLSSGVPPKGEVGARRWGSLLKRVGDEPDVWNLLPDDVREVLRDVSRRPVAELWAHDRFCNDADARAEARAYTRMMRGLAALDRLAP